MKATSYQAVVAQYHVESSDDEQDGGDHAHEHDGLMNYHQVCDYSIMLGHSLLGCGLGGSCSKSSKILR